MYKVPGTNYLEGIISTIDSTHMYVPSKVYSIHKISIVLSPPATAIFLLSQVVSQNTL